MRFDTIHRYNDEIKRIDKALDDLKEALTENKLEVKQLRDDVNEHETRITILENIHE